uniref:Carboxylesterase type B domain-containing protein n=1 Tax=Chelonoidis abingdonii TaxID=106734 RepID=A0A8C0FXR5_CHEAB
MMLGLLPAFPGLLLLSLLGPGSGSDDDGTVVLTTSGPIRGKRLQASSGTVTAFLGIPYAEPPVGALHFQKPLPHQPWSEVLETTRFGKPWQQAPFPSHPDAYMWAPKMPQSEDCLFLNIWVLHPWPPAPAPILVWIHAGEFFIGAASVELQDGRFLAATENVIVASMNYRLGVLGFLFLPPAALGNAGLWDQRLALRWLRDNAAASTSPLAWCSPKVAKKIGRALGHDLGCTDFNDTLGDVGTRIMPMSVFVPTVDGDFLTDEPPRLLEAGHRLLLLLALGGEWGLAVRMGEAGCQDSWVLSLALRGEWCLVVRMGEAGCQGY